jgi:uncharacterized damage-inducible protein DinB
VWKAVPDDLLDFKPHDKTNPIRTILVHQLLSESLDSLPQLAKGTTGWWLESRSFFGGLQRERILVFWRRVLHTCHHRTQVQTWLHLAGHDPIPAIYGPSGDVKWDEADLMYSLEATKRGGK